MAYSLSERFTSPSKCFPLNDPGSYQFEERKLKVNTVPFLSRVPRKTDNNSILWTQATYETVANEWIPNISSLKSKERRFPYDAFNEDDLRAVLCKCGMDTTCECPVENGSRSDALCQGKLKRRLFKGPAPRSSLGDEGLSAPSRNDHGFVVNSYGSQKRLRKENKSESPPFYDGDVKEFTTYYHGCKWSRRTSKRRHECLESSPGPADYNLQKESNSDEICAEKVRAHKRKASRQPRFIEMIQLQHIREGRPGPGSYSPSPPQCTNLKFIGNKANRFPSLKNGHCPGPADYYIRRNFDAVDQPEILCKANLPKPAFFGIKAQRFKQQREDGPGPATYNIDCNICRFVHCSNAPFGCSAMRFKSHMFNDSDEDEMLKVEGDERKRLNCSRTTWVFKSKTARMKPLVKKFKEPSPADIFPRENKCGRSRYLQYAAPFYSSEGRFHPWHNWIPVHSKFLTPTPCDYNAEKPQCLSAFRQGPMYRQERFPMEKIVTPAPNVYNVSGGIETILKTYNKKLKNNIENQHKYSWSQPVQKQILNCDQREDLLIQKCINLLEPTDICEVYDKNNFTNSTIPSNKLEDQEISLKDKVTHKIGLDTSEDIVKDKM